MKAVTIGRLVVVIGMVVPVLTTLPTPRSTAASPVSPGFSLTVSPSRMVVPAVETGQPRQFTVTNKGGQPLDVVVAAASFAPGDNGAPVFETDAPHSAMGWVAAQPSRFHLAAGHSEQVNLRIAVPATADPGEYQVAVIFSVPATNHTGIAVTRSVGAPVYVTVPGKAVSFVRVASLSAPVFALGGPIKLSAAVGNDGTVHRDFVASDRLVAKASGQTVMFPDFTVLRGETSQVSARWADPPWLCVCRVAVSVTNPDGTAQQQTATVVVVPPSLIGILAVLIFLVIGGLALRSARRRRPTVTASEPPSTATVDVTS